MQLLSTLALLKCLTLWQYQRAMFVVRTVRTVLKVPFEKAASSLPFRRF